MKPWSPWITALAFVVVGLILTTIFLTDEGTLCLVLGWVLFLERTLPRTTVDWPSVLVGCAALLLFTVGLHTVGRTLIGHNGGKWNWRWSLTCTALVVLMFTAGLAIIGVVHNVAWMATAREPTLVPTLESHGLLGTSTTSRNNLRWVGIALHSYAGASPNEALPKGGTFAEGGTMLHSWETELLPYLIHVAKYDASKPWNHPDNQETFKCVVPEFLNGDLRGAPYKDSDGYGLSHYSANSRVLAGNFSLSLTEMKDTSTTILVGEVNANFKPWGHPVNWRDPAKGLNRSPDGFGGVPGAGGVNFLMADGSVRFLSDRTSPEVLRTLSSPKREE